MYVRSHRLRISSTSTSDTRESRNRNRIFEGWKSPEKILIRRPEKEMGLKGKGFLRWNAFNRQLYFYFLTQELDTGEPYALRFTRRGRSPFGLLSKVEKVLKTAGALLVKRGGLGWVSTKVVWWWYQIIIGYISDIIAVP